MLTKRGITVIGGSTQDIMFYTNEAVILDNKKDLLRRRLVAFEYGAKIHSQRVYFSYGGGGANTAASLSSLGIKTKIITSVGHDAIGRDLLFHLMRRGVNIGLAHIRTNIGTAMSFVVNVGQSNEHVLFAYRGANDYLSLTDKIISKINTAWIYANSIAKIPHARLANFFTHCLHKKLFIAWNPSAQEINWGFKKLSKCLNQRLVLIMNRDEALQLAASIDPASAVKNNIKYLFKKLHKYQKLTVITDGANGAYVFDGQKIYYRKAINHKPVSTLGAGDAFGSAFVAGLIRYNWNIVKALHLGMLNSGSVVSKVGAQAGIMTKADLKKYKL